MVSSISKNDVWHKLLNYETFDLVKIAYESRHDKSKHKRNKENHIAHIREIIANFIQAREYFINAENASLTVRPLLLYYGVLGLSRGLILMLNSGLREAAMNPGHGLITRDWRGALADGLTSIADLKIGISNGTFYELLNATNNKSYLRHNCSSVNCHITYPIPKKDAIITFKNLAHSFPDLLREYEIWQKEKPVCFPIKSLLKNPDGTYYDIEFSRTSSSLEDNVKSIFSSNIENRSNNSFISASFEDIFLTQLFDGNFGIGDVYASKINDGLRLGTIPSFYCASFYLGMLSRYFPSIWVSLGRGFEGDCIYPLINKLLFLIRDRYPELILEFLNGKYSFEDSEPDS